MSKSIMISAGAIALLLAAPAQAQKIGTDSPTSSKDHKALKAAPVTKSKTMKGQLKSQRSSSTSKLGVATPDHTHLGDVNTRPPEHPYFNQAESQKLEQPYLNKTNKHGILEGEDPAT